MGLSHFEMEQSVEGKNGKIAYICLPCQFITKELVDKIKEMKKENEVIGLGIYSDDLIEILLKRKSVTNLNDRKIMAESLENVDFVFDVPTLNEEIINNRVNESYKKHLKGEEDCNQQEKKLYKIGYVPGTYDLLHPGHIENILIAKSCCEKVIIGVNAPEGMTGKDSSKIIMSTEERASVAEALKMVDGVYVANTPSKKDANKWVKENICKDGIDVIFAGEDRDEKGYGNGLKVIFTSRPKSVMKERSSTSKREKLKIDGYISNQDYTHKLVKVVIPKSDILRKYRKEQQMKEQEKQIDD